MGQGADAARTVRGDPSVVVNLHAKPYGWYAHHVHASDLHLTVTLCVFFRQAKVAGARIGDALAGRFSAAVSSAAAAAELPADGIVPLAYGPSADSVRERSLSALGRALKAGYSGLWLVLLPAQAPTDGDGFDEVDLAWAHLTEHHPISVLCVLPLEEYANRIPGWLRRRHAYYYSGGRLIR